MKVALALERPTSYAVVILISGDLAVTIIRGPGEALLGLVFGCVMGLLCWYLPHRKNVSFYKI